MTKRTVISFLIYGLVFAGLISRNGGMLALALPLMVYLIAGLLYRPEALNLTLSRQVSRDQVSPGEPVEVSLTISNAGQAIEEILIEETVPHKLTVTEGDTSVLTSLAPGETVSLTYTVQGERGVYFFSMVRVTVN
ncbi:MAG: NEW3 domain-containing protein, partial [Anaerolineae bacterium]|nr:NEW3 domain-containing protein [Anaerolineae bacterium]